MKIFQTRDLLWSVPLSLAAGAALTSVQVGGWLIGWLVFPLIFFCATLTLSLAARWAGGEKTLAWIVALAFALRLLGGVGSYLLLPVYGYPDDEEQSAGFSYTDAYRRDAQAWQLATSEHPIADAFSNRYASDQYGGLLAWSAFVYRVLSPDAHRVLILVLLSAWMGALGTPFLWKALKLKWDEKTARLVGWIFALYPEAILLSGVVMREPYLMAFSAFSLWGFIDWSIRRENRSLIWLALGIVGMLFVSPSIALMTLLILGGWLYFDSEGRRFAWQAALVLSVVFIGGLFLLSSALNAKGALGDDGPLSVIQNFIREAFKWNSYKIERESGWIQKLFDEMPTWMQAPFVMFYGVLQPILPAILIAPTTIFWKIVGILRATGWYAAFPFLILSFGAAWSPRFEKKRGALIWLSAVVWAWIFFSALRGGGGQWDNPRYRAILFIWQAILIGRTFIWLRESRNAWGARVFWMEAIFVIVFAQWYANRYLHIGGQLPFAKMAALILILWSAVVAWGVWRDYRHRV